MKTALIDDGLSAQNTGTVRLVVQNNHVIPDIDFNPISTTHGDACARNFFAVIEKPFDISIRLPVDCVGQLNVCDCITALNWCRVNGVNLVSISLGSNEPYDFPAFRSCLNGLCKAGVILVASAANNGLLTAPACFDTAYGVCAARDDSIPVGRYGYIEHPLDGIHWVYSPHSSGLVFEESSCSRATAAMAGEIYRLLTIETDPVKLGKRMRNTAIQCPFSYRIQSEANRDDTVYIALSPVQRGIAMTVRDKLLTEQFITAIVDNDLPGDPGEYRFSFDKNVNLSNTLPKLAAIAQAQVILACIDVNDAGSWYDMDFRGHELTVDALTRAILEGYT